MRIGLENDPFFRQSKNSLGREKVRKMRGPAVQNAMSDMEESTERESSRPESLSESLKGLPS